MIALRLTTKDPSNPLFGPCTSYPRTLQLDAWFQPSLRRDGARPQGEVPQQMVRGMNGPSVWRPVWGLFTEEWTGMMGQGMGKHPGELMVGSYEHCCSWRDRESMFARPGETLSKLSYRSSVSPWAREPRYTRPTSVSFPCLPALSSHWPTSTGARGQGNFTDKATEVNFQGHRAVQRTTKGRSGGANGNNQDNQAMVLAWALYGCT